MIITKEILDVVVYAGEPERHSGAGAGHHHILWVKLKIKKRIF